MLCASLGAGGRRVDVESIPIPIDCSVGIIEAFYARPERLLEDAVRQAQSSWTFVDPDVQMRSVRSLREDVDSGVWDRRYGSLRREPFYDGSLRLVVSNVDER